MSNQVTSDILLRLMELQSYRNVIIEAQDDGECVTDMLAHFQDELDDLVRRWNEAKENIVINSNNGGCMEITRGTTEGFVSETSTATVDVLDQ